MSDRAGTENGRCVSTADDAVTPEAPLKTLILCINVQATEDVVERSRGPNIITWFAPLKPYPSTSSRSSLVTSPSPTSITTSSVPSFSLDSHECSFGKFFMLYLARPLPDFSQSIRKYNIRAPLKPFLRLSLPLYFCFRAAFSRYTRRRRTQSQLPFHAPFLDRLLTERETPHDVNAGDHICRLCFAF